MEEYRKGTTCFEEERYEEAIQHLTRAIDHAARSNSYYFRGCAYGNLGDLDAAIADFTRTIGSNRNNAFAYAERSEAYRRQGESELAEADYRIAVELDPGLAQEAEIEPERGNH